MIVTSGMYDKEFRFLNNGKEESIMIKPLPTVYLKKLMHVANAFNSSDIRENQADPADSEEVKTNKSRKLAEIMNKKLADDQLLQDLIDITDETVKRAYPQLPPDVRDEFVSMNMFVILPFIFEVNFRK